MDKKTTIVSLYGGPGAGKSTSAAYLYYLMKASGVNAELVREYVKDWAWEGRKINTYDQIYFLGKQVRKESMLFGKVDWLVTDCPIMMSQYYASVYCTPGLAEGIRAAVQAFYQQTLDDGHEHYHVLLTRTKPYVAEGRYQTEAEAKEIDKGVAKMLFELEAKGMGKVIECSSDSAFLKSLWEQIKK